MTGALMSPTEIDAANWRSRALEAEARLAEADELLNAIRSGDVDAVVVGGPGATQVYTLENADRPYRVLIEQMQEGAVTVGHDGTVLYCNQRLAELLGRSREQVVGSVLATHAVAGDQTEVAQLIAACGPLGAKAEAALLNTAGRTVPVQLSFIELPPETGGVRMLCGVVTDLSEQKAHTAEITAANVRLIQEISERERVEDALRQAQKMEAIGQLTGGVAHDFNNLLTIIRSSADLLRRQEMSDERRRRYVDAISDTADRAARLTGQLLAFARRQALKPETFDVGARVDQITDMLRTVVGSRVQVVTRMACQRCFVLADPSQFETALVNVVVNARDAMDGEGGVTITVDQAATISGTTVEPGGGFVTVSIADTGCGIPPDLIDRIFEPFFTSKDVGKGTGLGLSQVYGFAKQSGGEVRVSSLPGAGATFTLYLPLREFSESLPAPAPSSHPIRTHGRPRILIVEDNPQVGEFATSLLADLGFAPVLASDASVALAMVEQNSEPFDIVFSDVMMPGMTGIQLAQILRARFPTLKIVLTSGYSQVLAQEGTHGFDLLQKPYSIDALSRILQRPLDSHP